MTSQEPDSHQDYADDLVKTDKSQASTMWVIAVVSCQFAVQCLYSALYAVSNPIQARLQFPHWSWALIQAIDPIVGLIIQPIVGKLSDACYSKWGRRRPYILTGAAITMISGVLLALVEYMSNSLQVQRALYLFFQIVLNIGLNGMQGPTETLCYDMLAEETVRGQSYASALVGFASIVANLPGAITAYVRSSFQPTTMVLVISVIFVAISIFVTCYFVHETPLEVGPGEERQSFVNPFPGILRDLKSTPASMWHCYIVVFIQVVAYVPWMVVVADFFGQDVYKGDAVTDPDRYAEGIGFGMICTCVSVVVGIIYCLFQTRLVLRFGIAKVEAFVQALMIVSFVPVLWVRNRWALMVLFALPGMNFLAVQSLGFAAVPLCIGERDVGSYTGLLNIFVEAGGEIGLLAFQMGVGSRWVSRAPTIFCGGCMAVIGTLAAWFWKIPDRVGGSALMSGELPRDEVSVPDDGETGHPVDSGF